MNLLKKIKEILTDNIRYIFAFLAMGLVFSVNKAFPAEIITSKKCQNSKCDEKLVQEPFLSDKTSIFFANDAFYSEGGEYFRLVFKVASSQDTEILLKTSSALGKEEEIKKIKIEKNKNSSYYEVLFPTEGKKTDLIFEKVNKSDGAEIFLGNIQISPLNVKKEKEFKNLKPTIFGKTETDVLDQQQPDGFKYFEQLSEPSIILGQVFVPSSDYIAGVLLDFDIVKQSDMKNAKYKLDLREAESGDGFFEIKNDVLASLSFSISDLDKYRMPDGKYLFPLFSPVEKGKNYYIGIDNGKVEINKFNFLKIKGTKDSARYGNGAVVVKNKGESYGVTGDLYFNTFGIKFNEYQGVKVLSGSVIEDSGKGKGFFKYQMSGDAMDLADLEHKTNDVKFDEDKKALTGKFDPGDESYMVYKFNAIYPFSLFHISMEKADISWRDLDVFYSLDGISWNQIPAEYKEVMVSEREKIFQKMQIIDYRINKETFSEEIFIKISPQKKLETSGAPDSEDNEKNYGVKNLKFEAELLLK